MSRPKAEVREDRHDAGEDARAQSAKFAFLHEPVAARLPMISGGQGKARSIAGVQGREACATGLESGKKYESSRPEV